MSGRAAGPPRGLEVYGPESEGWRLNSEAMLLLGAGPRALLLQIAHPLVAAGVAEHSDFRADPWRRLSGTLKSYLRIVYGTAADAAAEVRRLNQLHRGIEGEGYRALDPDLSLWVHATLVDSTMAAYDAWLGPLSRERRARYYAETLPVGRAFGIPTAKLPPDLEAFEAYWASMLHPGSPVEVGGVARELAHTILHPPLGPAVAAAGPPLDRLAPVANRLPATAYAWTLWPAIGLLPDRIRAAYGFAWGTRQQLVAAWLVRAWQGWRPLLPVSFRSMPQALRADRRVRSARHGGRGAPPQ